MKKIIVITLSLFILITLSCNNSGNKDKTTSDNDSLKKDSLNKVKIDSIKKAVGDSISNANKEKEKSDSIKNAEESKINKSAEESKTKKTAETAPEINTGWLDGTWTGTGYQKNAATSTTWSIKLVYNNSKGVSIIDYPSLGCGGNWKLKYINATKAEFTEYITKGADKCDNEGTVVITPIDSKHVSYSFFLPKYSKDVVAFSTLTKE